MRKHSNGQALVTARIAMDNCQRSGNTEWERRWMDRFRQIMQACPLDIDRTDDIQEDRIVFIDDSMIIDEQGYRGGFRNVRVYVRPTFTGYAVTFTGSGTTADHRDYLHEAITAWLDEPAPPAPWAN